MDTEPQTSHRHGPRVRIIEPSPVGDKRFEFPAAEDPKKHSNNDGANCGSGTGPTRRTGTRTETGDAMTSIKRTPRIMGDGANTGGTAGRETSTAGTGNTAVGNSPVIAMRPTSTPTALVSHGSSPIKAHAKLSRSDSPSPDLTSISTPQNATAGSAEAVIHNDAAVVGTAGQTSNAGNNDPSGPSHILGQGNFQTRMTPARTPAVSLASNNCAIDPLSQHIFQRTNTDRSLATRLRSLPPQPSSPSCSEGIRSPSVETPDAGKEKKKGVSFLSRLSMRGSKKKGDDGGDDDNGSEASERRLEGANARVFSTIVEAGGYIPHHKEPPPYIRTKVHNKKTREFNRMFLSQVLVGTKPPREETDKKVPVVTISSADGRPKRTQTGGAIWATEFSKDGKYLAAAGRDQVVRVWAIISTPEERRAHEEEEAAHGVAGERLSAPVFREKPVREFVGHTGEILDLSWSKNNFLLSTSMDKTVRLWHISRKECLCTFKHKEFVSKVAFHPRDDRFFLAGCLDATLRLWSIPDKNIAFSAQTQDLITAVAFSPDGKVAIAGLLSGVCNFYETEGLELQSQLHVRSSRGKNAKGSKITAIQTAVVLNENHPYSSRLDGGSITNTTLDPTSLSPVHEVDPANTKVLITSTDARVRLYGLRDKVPEVKFKGHEHACGQLGATFSDDGRYVVCPSEDRKVFIWNLGTPSASSSSGNPSGVMPATPNLLGADGQNRDKIPYESFAAHGSVVTTAIFAPTKTRRLLGVSGDPIYDLCNPPPVTLVPTGDLEDAAAVAAAKLADSSNPNAGNNNASQTSLSDVAHSVVRKKAEESPAYIARSTHYDGNIIVTTDETGIIKVFRQDCAFHRRNETWETGSGLSRKVTGSTLMGRNGSILTRTSASSAAHSRRGSLSQVFPPSGGGVVGSPSIGAIVPPAASSDRILNWRQGVEANGSVSSSQVRSGEKGELVDCKGNGDVRRSERSVSPTKNAGGGASRVASLANERRHELYLNSSPRGSREGDRGLPGSPASSNFSSGNNSCIAGGAVHHTIGGGERLREQDDRAAESPDIPTEPPTPAFSFVAGDDGSLFTGKNHPGILIVQRSTAKATPIVSVPEAPTSASASSAATGQSDSSGFWSLRWPRLPTIRMPTGSVSLPGFGNGSGNNTSQSASPSSRAHQNGHTILGSISESGAGNDNENDRENLKDRDQGEVENENNKLGSGGRNSQQKNGMKAQKGNKSSDPYAAAMSAARPSDPHPTGDGGDNAKTGVPMSSTIAKLRRKSAPAPASTSAVVDQQGGRLSAVIARPDSESTSTSEGDEMACRKCAGRELKSKRPGGRQRLLCASCGVASDEGAAAVAAVRK